MTDDYPIGGDGLSATTTAHCPRCDRREEIDGELEARAWLTAHIQQEHGDVLPAFKNG